MSKFDFRDFSIVQTNSPLKVGTDAILLGASVAITEDATRVLDVGTGTGVIALILASRFQHIHVTAVEPNESAFLDASFNFLNTKFSERLNILHSTVQDLAQSALFDVVVSNPPYFIDDLKSNNPDKKQAKHIDEMAFYDFIDACLLQLKETGTFWLVLPKDIADKVCDHLAQKGMKLFKRIRFHSNSNKPDIRWVVAFSKKENSADEQHVPLSEKVLHIRNTDGSFHQDYIDLAAYLHAKKL